MPSYLHEVLVEMFRDRPSLVAEVLSGPLGVEVPPFGQARVSAGELTDVAPTEYRADIVITLTDRDVDTPVLAVVVEVQLSADARKRRSWVAYVGTLYARLGCPVFLVVVCSDPVIAAWCATPIVVGQPGLALTPLVLGPRQVPVVTDPEWARRSPQLAVLSAMAHGDGPDQKMLFEALMAALDVVDRDHAGLYADVVLSVLPAAARDYLEGCMNTTTHRYQSDFARGYFAKGEARAVLAVLTARGIDVPDDVRERIEACTDLEQLETWIRRAVAALTVHDIFEDDDPTP